MKIPKFFKCILGCLVLALSGAAHGGTVVNFGSISQISGPGGLDLAGEMTHAINFSANDPARYVNGVLFTPDTALAPGLTVGPNNVTPWQTRPNFGSGIDADNLEEIYHDIRWANPSLGQTLEAHLPVTSGETYKVQILVYENSAGDRRWDIEMEGVITVDEFTSRGAATAAGAGGLPAYSATAGVVYTRTLVAGDGTLDIRMGNFGGVNDAGDRNPIWQGLTVEHILPDSDNDGLPDAWEIAKFGATGTQTGTDDSDSDGLTNQFEYQLNSNPTVADTDTDGLTDGNEYFTRGTKVTVADTDGDGLNDGAEITAGSNPLVTDSDGDSLSDGVEVNVYFTSPIDRDSDDDSYDDNVEVAYGTNPNSAGAYPLYSTFNTSFTGGDQGEGLDFQGTFIAAARFGVTTLTGSWPVGNATFVPYTAIAGLTQDAANQIDAWVNPAFASPTTNDNNLAQVIRSIRYGAPTVNIAIPGLLPGRSYKLQLLFAESCCANRGFDVWAEGALIADEFAPAVVMGGASGSPTRGAAIVHGFVAADTVLNIRLDKVGVTSPALNDVNVIINALSLEEIPAGADTDADDLPDAWEVENFGSTGLYGKNDDPDNDGLTNFQELTSVTKPLDSDTDDDGLNDGYEINTSHTSPRTSDSDGDGLSDSYEVNTSHTNPLLIDTDGDTLGDGSEVNTSHTSPLLIDSDNDGFNDPTELLSASDPNSATSTPGASYFARVLGAGPAKGLDLTGNFVYAFNVGTLGGGMVIEDADFTADTAPGITVSAPNEIPNWTSPNFGNSTEDDALENIFRDIRWADLANGNPAVRNVKVDLANLVVGRQYKLQLLFGEQCCPQRVFDINVEGTLVADDFHISTVQGPTPMSVAGAAVVHTFTAADTTLNIVLDGATVVPFAGGDYNPTLSGVTLEELVIPVDLDIASVSRTASSITINARGTSGRVYSVDYSTDLLSWDEVNDNLVPNGSGDAVWTDMDPGRTSAQRSYYRLRDPAVQ